MINILKALADPTRLRVLGLLSLGELSVRELTHILEVGQSTLSHHLKVLLEAGVITGRRQGTWSYYRLNPDPVFFNEIFPLIQERLQELPQCVTDSVRAFDLFEEQRTSNRRFFDREALQWDSVVRHLLPLPDYLGPFLEKIPKVPLAVEVGCGTGNLFDPLLSRTDFLIGVDQSSEMIEEARRKALAGNLKGFELRLGDMMHLPVENNKCDAVVMNMALHHAVQPLQALREVARILRDKGQFFLADMLPHSREWVRDKLSDRWLGFSRGDLEEWFMNTGMTLVTWQEMTGEGGQAGVFILCAEKSENEQIA